jgi:DNA-binding MarR family transcriptional regulator
MSTDVLSDRIAAIDEIAAHLLPRASQLTRLLLGTGSRTLTRAEGGLLSTLSAGPRRITELAATEVLAQPTVTQLVDRLQQRGLVQRDRDAIDRRVVLVSITDAGRAELEQTRAEYRVQLRAAAADLPDADVDALLRATRTLERLIDAVQERRA